MAMALPDDAQDSRITLWLFLGIALLIGMDVAMDLLAGSGLAHVAVEGSILVLAGVGALRMLLNYFRLERQAKRLSRDLAVSRAEAAEWRREAAEALAGLGAAVEKQFQRWGLTEAESQVALLLLKGLSLKEVAEVRSVSERTVRQQARAVYKKGGLEGRADLAAFFLEDLLLPAVSTGDKGTVRSA